MEMFFNLPASMLFASLAVFYGLTAALIYWLTFHGPRHQAIQSLAGIVPPFIGVVGILFGLLTGFLANDIGDRNKQAARAVLSEANALHDAFTLSIASYSDMTTIRTALRNYTQSALQEEWPQIYEMGRVGKTEAAFEDLLREVSNPGIPRVAGQAVHSALMSAVSRVGIARSERLAIAGDETNRIKWITVFVLGFLTQVAVGLVHLEKPRAQGAALTLFSIAIVIVLGLVGIQEQPFAGSIQVSPAPLQEFLDTMAAANGSH
jgi:hypothetical protein